MAGVENNLSLSLDDIIELNRSRGNSRAPSVAGSVRSFRSQRSQRSQRNYVPNRSNLSEKFTSQSLQHRNNLHYQRERYRSWRFYQQPRGYSFNQMVARQSVRRASRYLNLYNDRRRRFQPYVFVNTTRWQRPQQQTFGYWNQRRPVFGMFSPNYNRLQKMQLTQQKMNDDRITNHCVNDDTGSTLTICVTNDLYHKRQHSGVAPLQISSTSQRNIGRLNKANLARHNAATARDTKRSSSPASSVRTTFSKTTNKTAKRRERRKRARARSQAAAASTPARRRKGLNPAIQRAIASIQGKNQNRENRFTSNLIGLVQRPTASMTAISLNDRFRH